MTVVNIESSLESSGRDGGGGVGNGDGGESSDYRGRSSSPNSSSSGSGFASSSQERLPPAEEVQPMVGQPTPTEVGSASRTQSLGVGGDRILNGIPLFLLQGGMTVDLVPLVPVGGLLVIDDYDWASFYVNTQVSSYCSRTGLRDLVDRSYIVRDVVDARLIRAATNRENERVSHGKESSADDFFFIYANFFNQLHIQIPFIDF